MIRSRTPLSALQKTYDETYLTCSTAVYYESQGNEADAMRCWRAALAQINDHRANKLPPNYTSRSDTERALTDSIRQLELQCKERIDLLEALRLSRQEDAPQTWLPSSNEHDHQPASVETPLHERGWIGGGTIPAITYPELPRPALPRALTPKPPLPTRSSSEQARAGSPSKGPSPEMGPSQTPKTTSASGTGPSRSSSPERYTMRTTLRSAGIKDRSPRTLSKRPESRPANGPGASKAASLAWSALGLGDKPKGAAAHTASDPSPLVRNSSEPSRGSSANQQLQWDSNSRRLVTPRNSNVREFRAPKPSASTPPVRNLSEYPFPQASALSLSAASNALGSLSVKDTPARLDRERISRQRHTAPATSSESLLAPSGGSRKVTPEVSHDSSTARRPSSESLSRRSLSGQPLAPTSGQASTSKTAVGDDLAYTTARWKAAQGRRQPSASSSDDGKPQPRQASPRRSTRAVGKGSSIARGRTLPIDSSDDENKGAVKAWKRRKAQMLRNLPQGVDEHAAKQILNEIVVRGDEVRWDDVAGLEIAKNALREAVVYPFLRPDLFKGLREPARGMLLFGPPGTGKTMLARAVATESKSTFFSISASSLTSKYLGESEKLVRALFALAKALAPSIIFVDEIDSLLSQRTGSGEHEATRRIKTEFLIQWSDLQRAAAGREPSESSQGQGDVSRVLVLAATNLPWAIDEAARRRFVRRQYIPLPESKTRDTQLRTLLGQQKHNLTDADIEKLVGLTDGFSGSDITALAKDAAMGPLRSLGDALLQMTMDQIRPIECGDFLSSLTTIRPSVSKSGLEEYEKWAKEFGERGG